MSRLTAFLRSRRERRARPAAVPAPDTRAIENAAAIEAVTALWSALDEAYEPILATRDLECIVCGRRGRRSDFGIVTAECRFGGGTLERYGCPGCGCLFGPLKYLDRSDAFVNADYAFLYSYYSEGATEGSETRTFHSLKPAPGGQFVNWGCGIRNNTVPALRRGGWNVRGYEPATPISTPFVYTSLAEVPRQIDGIFSNNVIEHFRTPLAEFATFHRLLKPGGRMAHSTACYEYRYGDTRFHTLFLLGHSVEVLAERTGFAVVGRETDGEYMNVIFERLG